MARLNSAAAAAVCVLALTGCGDDNTTTPATPATSSGKTPTLGDPLTFVRADDKTVVGTALPVLLPGP